MYSDVHSAYICVDYFNMNDLLFENNWKFLRDFL